MKTMQRVGSLFLFGVLTVSSVFAAETPAAPAEGVVAKACAQDVEKLCPGTKPGEGRVMACLKANRAKVSDGCKAAIKSQRTERKAAGS
jgi:Cysteine rich repeat